MSLLAIGLVAGCHKNKDAEGPVERAGASVDDAAQKTGAALHKAAVKTDEAAHRAVTATGNAFEKAGQKLKGSPSATQPADSAPSESK
ncbi:MAG: hypothetical protein EOO73_01725 [Myxococcales bacterium]|nr:MAG: hypothetical protein EOO73_01725 [Myxococcales bacterium]